MNAVPKICVETRNINPVRWPAHTHTKKTVMVKLR